MPKGLTGNQYSTGDAVVGASGKPCRIWNVSWLSDGTARDLVLRNGSTASGTIYIQAGGTVSLTTTLNFEGGKLFPDGCFFDFTASMVHAVFEFEMEN